MLARSGFRNHAPLAHPDGEQRLTERVVDLVRAGVGQVLAFEQDPRSASCVGAPTHVLGEPGGVGERRGTPDVVSQQVVELGPERRIGERPLVLGAELVQRSDEGLGDVPTAEGPEASKADVNEGTGFTSETIIVDDAFKRIPSDDD